MTQSAKVGIAQRVRQWRWALQPAAIGLTGILLLVVVFAPPTESFCSRHSTGCGLVSGFVSTTLIAAAGYFFLVVWTLRRAIPRYLDLAMQTPERLLATGGKVRLGDIVRRTGLVNAVITELEPSRGGAPVLVVGAAGAGKTTFLLDLTSRIASRQAVPVVCSLRGVAPPLQIRALAHDRFVDVIDPFVHAADHAERIWRRLSANGEIVVVFDGLDEFMPGAPSYERDQAIRSALADVRNERLPVVVTSRPETLPVGTTVSAFPLDPLPAEDVAGYFKDRIPPGRLPDGPELNRLAELGGATPFYLDVIAALSRAGHLGAVAGCGGDRLHVVLLDEWVDLLRKQQLMGEIELDERSRVEILAGLGAVAYAMTSTARLDDDLATINDQVRSMPDALQAKPSVAAAVDGASRLGLVEMFPLGQSTGVRFVHAIGQAYFLSRLLDDNPALWKELVDGTPSAELNRALVMWCARDRDRRRATEVSDALTQRAVASQDADRALFLLVTAGEVTSAVSSGTFDALDGPGLNEAWSRASPRARLAAVRRLAACGDEWSIRVLQQRCWDRHENYRVRWDAAKAIMAASDASWSMLGAQFEQIVDTCAARCWNEWTDDQTHDISVTGWILPALTPTLSEANRRTAVRLIEKYASLVPDLPMGTEASLAQGFKQDALNSRGGSVSPVVWKLLKTCDFWYSRIMLAHAACIRAIADPHANRDVARRLSERARIERHPFVVAAMRLCERALRERTVAPWIWDDEVTVITRSGTALNDAAARLLGDIVLSLNLTEQGDDDERERRKEQAYRRGPQLPYCLSQSRTRGELFEECVGGDRCPFDLCPYPATADRALARGEFSEAFCRHMSDIAARRTSLQAGLAARRSAPWSLLAGRDAARFWETMQGRAF